MQDALRAPPDSTKLMASPEPDNGCQGNLCNSTLPVPPYRPNWEGISGARLQAGYSWGPRGLHKEAEHSWNPAGLLGTKEQTQSQTMKVMGPYTTYLCRLCSRQIRLENLSSLLTSPRSYSWQQQSLQGPPPCPKHLMHLIQHQQSLWFFTVSRLLQSTVPSEAQGNLLIVNPYQHQTTIYILPTT